MSQGIVWCLGNWIQKKEKFSRVGEFLSNIPEQCGKLAARLNLEFFETVVGIRL